MLPRRCSGQLSSMPWGTRGTVVSCAEKPVGVPSCRARRAQPPCCAPPDPTRPWCARVLDSTGGRSTDGCHLGKTSPRNFVLPVTILLGNLVMRRPVLNRTWCVQWTDKVHINKCVVYLAGMPLMSYFLRRV